MGFDRQSPERAQAGIIYVLHQCSDEGHVFMHRDVLLTKAREILEVDDTILTTALAALAAERHIVIEALPDVVEGEAVYLAKFHLSEIQAAPRSIREINVDTGPDVPARPSNGYRTSCPSHWPPCRQRPSALQQPTRFL